MRDGRTFNVRTVATNDATQDALVEATPGIEPG